MNRTINVQHRFVYINVGAMARTIYRASSHALARRPHDSLELPHVLSVLSHDSPALQHGLPYIPHVSLPLSHGSLSGSHDIGQGWHPVPH
ncbi:hypothetical protein [Lentibacillus persicus]|uniref:hypothetical protein n=1 Tax=Lentibacillus persicus TaxID=640948 RepID=UPI0011601864|nr:hypothetical protein [Lentibacillus persicus]